MKTLSTRPTTRPNFRVFVYNPRHRGGALYTTADSWKTTHAEAISATRNKLYRQGVSAHYYDFVAVDCKNQSSKKG